MIDDYAARDLRKIDKHFQKKILHYLETRLSDCDDPRVYGKPLKSHFKGLWRFRVENFRIICRINDTCLTVLVIRIGHRKDVYH